MGEWNGTKVRNSKNEVILWECDYINGSPVRGKARIPHHEDLYFEGELKDFKPHGSGSIKVRPNGKEMARGIWEAGRLVSRTGPLGEYRGKFDVSGAAKGPIRIFNSKGKEIFCGKVDNDLKPVGKSFSAGFKEKRPSGIVEEDSAPEIRSKDRVGAYSSLSRKCGVLYSMTEGWGYIGGVDGDKRSHEGMEASEGAYYHGHWTNDVRNGLGVLQWPDEPFHTTAREYKDGVLISEQTITDRKEFKLKLRPLAVRWLRCPAVLSAFRSSRHL